MKRKIINKQIQCKCMSDILKQKKDFFNANVLRKITNTKIDHKQ